MTIILEDPVLKNSQILQPSMQGMLLTAQNVGSLSIIS